MTNQDAGSPEQPQTDRPDFYTRISESFRLEERDWNTVSRRVATRVLAGGGAALVLLASGVGGFRAVYANKIYPKIYIGDVPVGGMTAAEATAAVQKRVQELDTTCVQYSLKKFAWTPTLTELGITADVAEAVKEAMDLGRDGKAAERLMYTSTLAEGAQVVPLQFSMQPRQLTAWFDSVDADINEPAIDATFTVKGTTLDITPDSTGTGADRDTVTAHIFDALQTLNPINDTLPTATAYPRITRADLEANETEVLHVISNSVGVRFGESRWDVLPEEISEFMIFTSELENGQAVTHVDFDRTGLSKYLRERFGDSVNRMPVNARVQFYGGKLSATSKAQDGTRMKANDFADLVAESFLGNHERVDVPVLVTPALVREDNLDSLGIKDRLSRVDSNYQSDLGNDRGHNVEVGVALINNIIVSPGEDFSFNKAVGSIDANPDFRGGTGIVAGVIQDEFGGGICQVTTTAFRAAIYAGFPITQWYPHTYRLGGYERDGWSAGFDASILQPEWQEPSEWADFRFTNNTENFILISSWVDNGIHVMEIYGTDPGWDVVVSDARTWEAEPSNENRWVVDDAVGGGTNFASAWPLEGSNVAFNRTVLDSSGKELYTRDFVSPYKGRGWQCTCSADMYGVPCW